MFKQVAVGLEFSQRSQSFLIWVDGTLLLALIINPFINVLLRDLRTSRNRSGFPKNFTSPQTALLYIDFHKPSNVVFQRLSIAPRF